MHFSRRRAVAGTCPEQLPHARYRWRLLLTTLDNHGQPAALTPARQAGRAVNALHGEMPMPLWQQHPDLPHGCNALHGEMPMPLWQQHPDLPHGCRQWAAARLMAAPQQLLPGPHIKILSTTHHFQCHRSCAGICAPSPLGTRLGWSPGPGEALSRPPKALDLRTPWVMALLQTCVLDTCDDFGNRNGLNICSGVASVFVCQAQRDFSSASA